MHRDVKPGNFLFRRKLKKGYLIDFNLANVSARTVLTSSLLYDAESEILPLCVFLTLHAGSPPQVLEKQ